MTEHRAITRDEYLLVKRTYDCKQRPASELEIMGAHLAAVHKLKPEHGAKYLEVLANHARSVIAEETNIDTLKVTA